MVPLVGDRVELWCSTKTGDNTVWSYGKSFNDKRQRDIVRNGKVLNGNNRWCELNKQRRGDFNLVIRAIAEINSSVYWCTEDDGQGLSRNVFNVTVSS